MTRSFKFGLWSLLVASLFAGCNQSPSPSVSTTFPTSCTSCTTTGTATGTTYTGTFQINASATTASVGSTINLAPVANGVSNPVYTWTQVSPSQGPYVTMTDAGNGSINVTSQYSMTVQIQVVETSSSDATLDVYTDVTLQFTGGSTTGSTTGVVSNTPLNCTLSHVPATYYVGSPVYFNITTSTGESVIVTQWDPGEAGLATTLPLNPPLEGIYDYAGLKNVSIVAESISRPGTYCNGGAALTDQVYINPLTTVYY